MYIHVQTESTLKEATESVRRILSSRVQFKMYVSN